MMDHNALEYLMYNIGKTGMYGAMLEKKMKS